MTRLSLYSTICRPDQQPYCSPTFNSSPTSSVAGLPGLTLLLLTSILVIWMSKHLLKGSDNMHGTGGILVGILLPTGVVVSMTYWVLDTAHGHSYILPGGLQTLQLWIPRIGFTTLVMGLVFVWVSDSLSMTVEVSSESGPTQIIPQSPKTLLVRGLANAIGSSYFSFSASLTICLGLVQKPMGCAMLYLCFSQVCVLVELMHLWRDKVSVGDLTMGVFEELDEVPQSPRTRSISARQKTALPPTRTTTVESGLLFLYTVILFLLGVRYFYATGHQRALSTIQYEVGFIGLEKVNWVLSPLMILVNTYGGPILTSFCLPLLVTWKRPLLKIHDSRFKTELSLLVATYLSLILSGLTSATLFAGHFRRHMTGWRVFAPKYLFSLGETGLEIVVIVVGIVWVWIAVGQYQEFLRRLVLHTRPKSKSV